MTTSHPQAGAIASSPVRVVAINRRHGWVDVIFDPRRLVPVAPVTAEGTPLCDK